MRGRRPRSTEVFSGISFVYSKLVRRFREGSAGFAELGHAWLEVVQWPFDKCATFFVVCEEVVPERMLKATLVGSLFERKV